MRLDGRGRHGSRRARRRRRRLRHLARHRLQGNHVAAEPEAPDQRSQPIWMATILCGILVLPIGLCISTYYLVRIRPSVAAAEDGRVVDPPSRRAA